MRELINIITESIGLAHRKPGETFINPKGETIIFMGLAFYPNEGRYENFDDLDAQLAFLESQGTPITFVNKRTARSLAFGVATFKDTNGTIVRFGRYLTNISPVFIGNKWENNDLPNGFRYNKGTSLKVDSGMMPQDILTDMTDLSPSDIVEQVAAKFGASHALTIAAKHVAAGEPMPIEIIGEGLNYTAVTNYFCELLQPMALINGQCTGNASEAAMRFFDGDFTGAKISFSTGKNEGLYDSILTKNGKEIRISTKAGQGAKASVSNLLTSVNELTDELKEQFADVISMLKRIEKNGYIEGPLSLAQDFGIISGADADIVRKMKSAKEFTLSKNLQEIYSERAARVKEGIEPIPFYLMLAAIAERVAEYINDNTNFSDAAATILNNGALVQVYTNAVDKNGVITIRGFNSVYPSTMVAGVQFDATKTYYSNGNKGNFTFKILLNKAEPAAPVVPKPEKKLATRVDIRPKRAHTSPNDGAKATPRQKR